MLEHTFERRYVGSQFGDIPLGLYVVRGENVSIVGEVDDSDGAIALERVSAADILAADKSESDASAAAAAAGSAGGVRVATNKTTALWDMSDS